MYDIARFEMNKTKWTGTAAELVALLDYPDMQPNYLMRKMNSDVFALYNKFGISYVQNKRTGDERTFMFRSLNPVNEPEAPMAEPAENDSTQP